MTESVDASDAFPTPFERRRRERAAETIDTLVGVVAEDPESIERAREVVVQTTGPQYARDPSIDGHGLVVNPKRYSFSWSCTPCGVRFGSDEDSNENVPAKRCPVCGRAAERGDVIDRQVYARPPLA